MWKLLSLSIVALIVVGCAKPKKVAVVYPPLITADAAPVISKSKKSAGIKIDFKNITDSSYSYARFKLTAYNSTGDVIKPKKGNRSSAYVRLAGPINPGASKTTTWSNTWANNKLQCISLDEVELIFADGSVETATDNRLLSNKQGRACI